MKQAIRVQALYSFKQKGGNLIPRGIYSVDTPGGIPQLILDEVALGSATVRVLEWGKEETKAKKEAVVEPEADEDEDEGLEPEVDEEVEAAEKPTKVAKLVRRNAGKKKD